MSSLAGLRGTLLLQAALTAGLPLVRTSSQWTVASVVVGIGAVFVALALRPDPTWRWFVTGYEGFAVGYGLVALVSDVRVPGTLVAVCALLLLSRHGAAAFAGAPTWEGPAVPLPFVTAPPAVEEPAPAAEPLVAPVLFDAPAPVVTVPAPVPVVVVPAQELAPRPVAVTVLPGR